MMLESEQSGAVHRLGSYAFCYMVFKIDMKLDFLARRPPWLVHMSSGRQLNRFELRWQLSPACTLCMVVGLVSAHSAHGGHYFPG